MRTRSLSCSGGHCPTQTGVLRLQMWIWQLYQTLQRAAGELAQHMAEVEPQDHEPAVRSERPEGWPLEPLLVVEEE